MESGREPLVQVVALMHVVVQVKLLLHLLIAALMHVVVQVTLARAVVVPCPFVLEMLHSGQNLGL